MTWVRTVGDDFEWFEDEYEERPDPAELAELETATWAALWRQEEDRWAS